MGFAATAGGLARCWPEVANRADRQIGEAPGRAHQGTLGWCAAAGPQSFLMSKETLQSYPALICLPHGPKARLQH